MDGIGGGRESIFMVSLIYMGLGMAGLVVCCLGDCDAGHITQLSFESSGCSRRVIIVSLSV